MAKVFSLNKFLETVNAEKEKGIITQKDIDNARATWVDKIAGKTAEEIDELLGDSSSESYNKWLVEA